MTSRRGNRFPLNLFELSIVVFVKRCAVDHFSIAVDNLHELQAPRWEIWTRVGSRAINRHFRERKIQALTSSLLFSLSRWHLVQLKHALCSNHTVFRGMFSFTPPCPPTIFCCCCVPLCCHRESGRFWWTNGSHMFEYYCSLAVCARVCVSPSRDELFLSAKLWKRQRSEQVSNCLKLTLFASVAQADLTGRVCEMSSYIGALFWKFKRISHVKCQFIL